MKFSTAVTLLALPAMASAFAPVAQPARRTFGLSAIKTGPNGKPAKSAEEDMDLTRQVIAEFMGEDEPAAEADAEEKDE
eukprot:CAMPEP_0195263644 /NCGR_PEP_ID=MMETSP0706-20130129/10422_1 /TAXON_ID=33640 /ORGANISM="Asterionellopsis glacialis, Strain CCMP134" /LENGTH=78 /DNA_ID=CAMNT_0040317853 /DNA_START=130 /DNA_END=366 /DNA_ORIENTATION=-